MIYILFYHTFIFANQMWKFGCQFIVTRSSIFMEKNAENWSTLTLFAWEINHLAILSLCWEFGYPFIVIQGSIFMEKNAENWSDFALFRWEIIDQVIQLCFELMIFLLTFWKWLKIFTNLFLKFFISLSITQLWIHSVLHSYIYLTDFNV